MMLPKPSQESLESYAAAVRLSQWLDGQYDLAAALKAPLAPKGDNTTSTVRPGKVAR